MHIIIAYYSSNSKNNNSKLYKPSEEVHILLTSTQVSYNKELWNYSGGLCWELCVDRQREQRTGDSNSLAVSQRWCSLLYFIKTKINIRSEWVSECCGHEGSLFECETRSDRATYVEPPSAGTSAAAPPPSTHTTTTTELLLTTHST